jgi:hypothetical protein
MRDTETRGWISNISSKALMRSLRLAGIALGIGLVMSAGVARAQDDEDDGEDDKSFEQKIIGGIMAGIGGTNMENRGIDYRERSPLVVPPRLDLPPPEVATRKPNDANWPKDQDDARRRAAIKARKETNNDPELARRILSPSELNAARTKPVARTSNDPVQPGASTNPMLSPSQLGYTGGLTGLFGGNNKEESAPFTGEPVRESLTQPPPGYQTPSSNYAYGTNQKFDSLNKDPTTQNPMDPNYAKR